MRINDSLRTDIIATLASTFNSGMLRIYTGAMPAADAAPTGTLLVTINLPNPALAAGTAGVQNRNGTWQGTAVADGTAGYVELTNAAGTKRIYLTVSATGGAGQVQIQDDQSVGTTSIVSGGVVTVTSATLTQPAQ
jgi:hypothetical protein